MPHDQGKLPPRDSIKASTPKRPNVSPNELSEGELNNVSGGTTATTTTPISPRDPASGLPTGQHMHKP